MLLKYSSSFFDQLDAAHSKLKQPIKPANPAYNRGIDSDCLQLFCL